jgi:CO/xanthine dehydrogenase Mo-binding subunit
VIPGADGGVDIYVASQWLHADGMQVAECLGIEMEKVRLTLAGVGGAFGGREDLSVHVHASMLALQAGRPIKMVYSREESFVGGHVHRHPARMRYEHGATRDGRLVYVTARIVMDGGAYASTSSAVAATAAVVGAGPYEVPNAELDAYAVYTNNPPCGAMRGFGSVQVCFAHESQMDKLAAELGMDPLELRLRNAMKTGTRLPTGQVIEDRAPIARMLSELQDMPLPPDDRPTEPARLPGGHANTTHGEAIRRGVGYGIGLKNISFPAGFPDFSTATVTLSVAGGEPIAEVHTAAAEVGQGLVTIQAQIARTELGVDRAFVRTADTTIGMAGGSSASRQTWMTGGAVKAACEAVRAAVLDLARGRGYDVPDVARLEDCHIVDGDGVSIAALAEVLADTSVQETREYFPPRPTTPLDENGQGRLFMAYAFSAHRAVVDVDTELGLVKVVEIATVQDVGKAMSPQAVEGQIEGGIAQGLGLALMEELVVEDGRVLNGSFTDYLIPTTLDMPPVRSVVLELALADSPYGVTGAGEPPVISSPAAVAAAVRAATGRELNRIPLRPEAISGLQG